MKIRSTALQFFRLSAKGISQIYLCFQQIFKTRVRSVATWPLSASDKIITRTNRPDKGNDTDCLSLESFVRVFVGVQVRRICVKSLCWELRKMKEKIREYKCEMDWKWEIRQGLKSVKWNCCSMCSEYHWISAMAGAVWTPVEDETLAVQETDGRHIFSSCGTSSVWPVFKIPKESDATHKSVL
jgi:hypothetical protein